MCDERARGKEKQFSRILTKCQGKFSRGTALFLRNPVVSVVEKTLEVSKLLLYYANVIRAKLHLYEITIGIAHNAA